MKNKKNQEKNLKKNNKKNCPDSCPSAEEVNEKEMFSHDSNEYGSDCPKQKRK